MNAMRCDWKDAMRCATPEQWVSLAILCAAGVYRSSSWQNWAVAWLRGERREAGCDAFAAARAASATEDDLADQARRLFVGGGAARDLNELSRQICAARAAARAAGAAIPVRDDDPSGAARHACQSALGAGLSEAALSMAIDAVLSEEAIRLLDAMGEK